jgi:hypothetical protein
MLHFGLIDRAVSALCRRMLRSHPSALPRFGWLPARPCRVRPCPPTRVPMFGRTRSQLAPHATAESRRQPLTGVFTVYEAEYPRPTLRSRRRFAVDTSGDGGVSLEKNPAGGGCTPEVCRPPSSRPAQSLYGAPLPGFCCEITARRQRKLRRAWRLRSWIRRSPCTRR